MVLDDPRTKAVAVVALVNHLEEADRVVVRVGLLLPVPWGGDNLLWVVEGVMVT
ncbi:MAG TPA: hypothetical protein VK399_05905 [Longimicrobiaceae bacterium]|nr:hypothetical protein [Longimicrobiaceae bacterium]